MGVDQNACMWDALTISAPCMLGLKCKRIWGL